jgi:hypothetical protein
MHNDLVRLASNEQPGQLNPIGGLSDSDFSTYQPRWSRNAEIVHNHHQDFLNGPSSQYWEPTSGQNRPLRHESFDITRRLGDRSMASAGSHTVRIYTYIRRLRPRTYLLDYMRVFSLPRIFLCPKLRTIANRPAHAL